MKLKRILKGRKKNGKDDEQVVLSSATVAVELDKPRPLYVAGENISGCLVFILPLPAGVTEDYEALAAETKVKETDDEDNDGLFGGISAVATLMGTSQSSWKRHRGDTASAVFSPTSSPTRASHKQRTLWNRTFLYSQMTLLGNLYETGPRRIRKGSDLISFADSEDCPSLGEILLAEDTRIEEDSPWKLRVCFDGNTHYNEKDMILKGKDIGETTVDVLKLASASGEIQSLALSRPERPSTLIVDDNKEEEQVDNKERPVASEVRVSCNFAHNQMVFKVHSVSLRTPPLQEGMVYVKLWDPKTDEVNLENFEYDNEEKPTALLVTLPFSFAVPPPMPGSAQISGFEGRSGKIRYWLGAHIQVENEKPQGTRQLIYILARNPIPKPFMLFPAFTAEREQTITCPRWQGRFPQEIGTVDLKLSLDKRLYVPGETINLAGSEVANHTTGRIIVMVSLIRQVTLTALEGDVVWQETTTKQYPLLQTGSVRKFAAKLYQEDTWDFSAEEVELVVPACTPSFFPARVKEHGKQDYWPVSIAHSIELSAKKEGGESSIAKVEIPIALCSLPLSQGSMSSETPLEVPNQEASAMDTSFMGSYVDQTLQVDVTPSPIEIETWPDGELDLNEVWGVRAGDTRATFSTSTEILTVQTSENYTEDDMDSRLSQDGSVSHDDEDLTESELVADDVQDIQKIEESGQRELRQHNECETEVGAKESNSEPNHSNAVQEDKGEDTTYTLGKPVGLDLVQNDMLIDAETTKGELPQGTQLPKPQTEATEDSTEAEFVQSAPNIEVESDDEHEPTVE